MKRIITTFALLILFSLTSWQGSEKPLVDLATLSESFVYEMRYATPDNFMSETLYDCAKCLLRPEVAAALVEANDHFESLGYRIRIYDCYRPLDVQKKMWNKLPKLSYVGNPYGRGSIHNRGAAVDMTIETIEGCHVEMGTEFDHLGPAANIDNYNFPKEILNNRKLLWEGMKKFGFYPIRTEWWHFNFQKNRSYDILNIPIPCD